MAKFKLIIPFLFCFLYVRSSAQVSYTIVEIKEAPKIDGLLDEASWALPDLATNFTQTIPKPLAPATHETVVRMTYTQEAIFIGATLYQPKESVRKQLTARDGIGFNNADVFGVYFDTYQDQQNGFAFKVSAAGVQQEEKLMNGGGEGTGDVSWDARWDSKVKIYDDYWVVEMKIPFQALRFPDKEIQQWGLQFYRLNRKENESSYWKAVNPRLTGFLAQAGTLTGLKSIKPPIRLIFFPYLSTGFQQIPDPLGHQNRKWLRSGGMDVKYGLSDAFTLDLSLIPDFSQVISDNLIRNVSPFEQQLSENRPFFTEGMELFNKLGLFYSRRIGERPSGYNSVQNSYADTAQYEIIRNPIITPLYNTFKISGRTKGNVGIGILNALGAPARATIKNRKTGEEYIQLTEELANYNVLVFDKSLRGQSFINFTNTNVIRRGARTEGNVSATELKWFDKKEAFFLDMQAAVSARTQEKTGLKLIGEWAKISGKVRFNHRMRYLSPAYNQSDMGLQFDFNELQSYTQLRYFENKPKAYWLQLYNLYLNNTLKYNAAPWVFKSWDVSLRYFMLRKNFWDISYYLETSPILKTDFYQLRFFNKRMKNFPYVFNSTNGSTDSRKKWFWAWDYGLGVATIQQHPLYMYANNTVRYRFNDKLEVSLAYNIKKDESNVGYSFYDDDLNEPIIAYRHIREQSAQLSMNYNFSPTLNFTGRFRHYNSRIRNNSFHTVDALGNWFANSYDVGKTSYDENFNLQNVDLFLNWIYSPGSRMVLSYKQWLNDAYVLNSQLDNSFGTNFGQIISKPKAFELAVRFIYYLDYNSLRDQHAKQKVSVKD